MSDFVTFIAGIGYWFVCVILLNVSTLYCIVHSVRKIELGAIFIIHATAVAG